MALVVGVKTISEILLRLSLEEAMALMAVVRRVGGHLDTTRNGHIFAILTALETAGIPGNSNNDLVGEVRFQEPPKSIVVKKEETDGGV